MQRLSSKSKEYIEDSDDEQDDEDEGKGERQVSAPDGEGDDGGEDEKRDTVPVTAAASEDGMDVDAQEEQVPRETVPTSAPGVEAYGDDEGK
jgi:hypothetical protein